jgi:hypothetical protein
MAAWIRAHGGNPALLFAPYSVHIRAANGEPHTYSCSTHGAADAFGGTWDPSRDITEHSCDCLTIVDPTGTRQPRVAPPLRPILDLIVQHTRTPALDTLNQHDLRDLHIATGTGPRSYQMPDLHQQITHEASRRLRTQDIGNVAAELRTHHIQLDNTIGADLTPFERDVLVELLRCFNHVDPDTHFPLDDIAYADPVRRRLHQNSSLRAALRIWYHNDTRPQLVDDPDGRHTETQYAAAVAALHTQLTATWDAHRRERAAILHWAEHATYLINGDDLATISDIPGVLWSCGERTVTDRWNRVRYSTVPAATAFLADPALRTQIINGNTTSWTQHSVPVDHLTSDATDTLIQLLNDGADLDNAYRTVVALLPSTATTHIGPGR